MKAYAISTGVALGLALGLTGCPEDGPRKIGASCTSDGQCASGLCAANTCLDPEADDDGDSLVNRIEAALGTDPLAKDSDGDGVDDAAELGDLAAPTDSDGDGRLDAVESATADADSDCVVDQEDPRDSLSDPPSEELPEACGDGSYSCAANPLVGTCAAALGTMAAECFQAFGPCQVTISGATDGSSSVVWDSGARMVWKMAGDGAVGQLIGPDGATCGTLRVTDAQSDNPTSTLQVTGGPTFGIGDADGATVFTCPSGEQVTLRDSDAAAFSRCSGADSTSRCTVSTPYTCAGDVDCAEGSRCCAIPQSADPSRYCLPVDTCPELP